MRGEFITGKGTEVGKTVVAAAIARTAHAAGARVAVFKPAVSGLDDYPLRPRPGRPWFGSGRHDSGVAASSTTDAGSSLHAEQHFEYHRPLRAGDVLHAISEPGRSWEKTGRSGRLLSTPQNGPPITTRLKCSVAR